MWYLSSLTRDGICALPPAVEAWSLNHWITREVPGEDLTVWLWGRQAFSKGLRFSDGVTGR